MGLAALDALLALASGEPFVRGRERLLPAELIVRKSCGARRSRR
jgi:DNA-binding LacI/PurR family transcriptional regulator